MSKTQTEARALAIAFEADGATSDYWEFDAANGQDKIFITMTKGKKGQRRLAKAALNDSYWVSSGPTGSPCSCCGGSGRG
jgi:hypothetical protein